MRIRYTVLFIISVLPAAKVAAQGDATQHNLVTVNNLNIDRGPGSFTVEMSVDFDNLRLERNQELKVTPMAVFSADTVYMEPIYFRSANRAKEESRANRFDRHMTVKAGNTYDVTVHRSSARKHEQMPDVVYRSSQAHDRNMGPGQLVLREELTGCCSTRTYDIPLEMMPAGVMPLLTYLVPAYDTTRTCYLELVASVNFRVDKSLIETRFEHNDEELASIYDFMDKAMNSGIAAVNRFRITGYASPEASYEHNDKLSAGRVNALKERLMAKYNLPSDMFVINNVPEDWDSLRRWVAASDLRHARQVLDIIDTTADPDARDNKIKAIDNGETYRILLDDAYPDLRRTEVRACYDLPRFTEEQIWDIIRNNPDFLSLRDVYMLSGRLDPESPEYEYLYDVALKRYPEDKAVLINSSSIAMRNGDKVKAAYLLAKASDNPASYNNIGVLYALTGDPARAGEFFGKAVEAGYTDASDNLNNLDWLEIP